MNKYTFLTALSITAGICSIAASSLAPSPSQGLINDVKLLMAERGSIFVSAESGPSLVEFSTVNEPNTWRSKSPGGSLSVTVKNPSGRPILIGLAPTAPRPADAAITHTLEEYTRENKATTIASAEKLPQHFAPITLRVNQPSKNASNRLSQSTLPVRIVREDEKGNQHVVGEQILTNTGGYLTSTCLFLDDAPIVGQVTYRLQLHKVDMEDGVTPIFKNIRLFAMK